MIDDLKMATATPASSQKEDDGASFIPASQRPDGTWRKPRRVRDGYVPQDEVPLYESKGKQWAKNKPTYPVGMCPEVMAASKAARNSGGRNPIPGLTLDSTDEALKSKKKKKKKPSVESGVVEVTTALKGTQLSWPGGTKEAGKVATKAAKGTPATQEPVAAVDPAKRVKNLKKRLREVELLEQKIASGELKAPDKDQLEKLKRKNDLRDQIEELEAEIGN